MLEVAQSGYLNTSTRCLPESKNVLCLKGTDLGQKVLQPRLRVLAREQSALDAVFGARAFFLRHAVSESLELVGYGSDDVAVPGPKNVRADAQQTWGEQGA